MNRSRIFILSAFFILPLSMMINYNDAHGEEVVIPEWFFDVIGLWLDEQVSDRELFDAVAYLEKIGAINLVYHKDFSTDANFLIALLQIERNEFGRDLSGICDSNWFVTGYYIPLESSYSGDRTRLLLNGTEHLFFGGFINEVERLSWGKTLSGNYLHWDGDEFSLNSTATDVTGEILTVGTIGISPELIPIETRLFIPSLPSPWDSMIFTVHDPKTQSTKKDISIFTGEGVSAKNEAQRITGFNNLICMQNYFAAPVCHGDLCGQINVDEITINKAIGDSPALPDVEILSIKKFSAESEDVFNVSFKVYAKDADLSNVWVLIESDSDDSRTIIQSIFARASSTGIVKIQADDTESITVKILSYEISD